MSRLQEMAAAFDRRGLHDMPALARPKTDPAAANRQRWAREVIQTIRTNGRPWQ